MPSDQSVTGWMHGLQQGNAEAAQRLWERYFSEMVRIAGAKLPRSVRRVFDEEDVALSAFKSFCAGVEEGKFPNLSAREDLWRLLVVITARKAQVYKRHATRQKRGGGQVVGETDLVAGAEDASAFESIITAVPTPDFLAQAAEEFDRLLALLGENDLELRQITILKMEGHTVKEIAEKLNLSHRVVERRLQAIRQIWSTKEAMGAE